MRVPVMVLGVLLATGAVAGAQPGPPVKPNPAGAVALDQHLRRWEQEMRKVQTLSALLNRIDKDKVFQTTSKSTGFAQYMKSGTGPTTMNLALMELKPENKAEISEKFICTGTSRAKYPLSIRYLRVPLVNPQAGSRNCRSVSVPLASCFTRQPKPLQGSKVSVDL